jgi:hypothetical protein
MRHHSPDLSLYEMQPALFKYNDPLKQFPLNEENLIKASKLTTDVYDCTCDFSAFIEQL